MTRLNKFVTAEELESVRTAQKVSGMFLSGGRPMGYPQPCRTALDSIQQTENSYRHKMKLAELLSTITPLPYSVSDNSIVNVLPGLVEALRDAVEILAKDFDYRPDDDGHWDNIQAALASAEEVNTTTQAL